MASRTARLLLAATALLVCLPLPARQPAGIRWRQVAGGGVTVVFVPGLEAAARHALAFSRDLLPRLQRFWGVRLRGPVRILIDDFTDRANGSSGYYPFNLIEVHRVEPPPESELGSSRDWLELVLTHELSHLCTLHAAHAWLRSLRTVFGTHAALFPIAAMPGWTLEGLAIYGESSFGEPGRLHSPDFRLFFAAAARAGRIPTWRRLTGQPTFWPGPLARYLFGAMFYERLAETYGHDKVIAYLHRQGDVISFFSSGWGFYRAFGVELPALWQAFRDSAPRGDAGTPGPGQRLTRGGYYKEYPLEVAPGRIVYAREDYRRYPGVEEVTTADGRVRVLVRLAGINGLSLDEANRRLLLSAVDGYRAWGDTSDLYAYDLARGQLRRLSRGRRLSAPVADPAGGAIFCIQRSGERSRLVRFEPGRGAVEPLSAAYESLAQTAVSADGSLLAAALKVPGRNWGIAVFSRTGELRRVIAAADGGKWHQPVWHDGDLYFIAETDGRYRLARCRPASGAVECLAGDDLPAPRHFAFSRDGARLIYSDVGADGFDIGLLPLAGAGWRPLAASAAETLPEPPPLAGPPAAPYRPLPDLLPHFWTPLLRLAGRDLQLGAMTAGQDAPATHVYSLDAYWGVQSRQASVSALYQFNGLLPVLELQAKRRYSLPHDAAGDYNRMQSRLQLGADWPLRMQRRWQLWLHSDVHAERTRETAAGRAPYQLDLHGVRLGLKLLTAQTYYDSIAPADGLRLNLTGQRDWRGWGSSFDLSSALAEYRHYVSLPRPHQLAWRLAVADSWGDGRRLYRLGGAASQEADHAADGDPFGLMRGYPDGSFSGRGGWLFNLEYRLALFKVERSVPLSINVNRFYLALFTDAGNLWGERRVIVPSFSFGAEVNAVLYFIGYRWVAAAGMAVARRPDRPLRLFARLGASF